MWVIYSRFICNNNNSFAINITNKSMLDKSLKCVVYTYGPNNFPISCLLWKSLVKYIPHFSFFFFFVFVAVYFFLAVERKISFEEDDCRNPLPHFWLFLGKGWVYFSSLWFYEMDIAENGLSKHSFCLWALALNYLVMVTNIFTKISFSSLHCRE